ncbi:hypothetical protein MTR_1g064620 [Medicago truncatula]|uniref:Uncharacterized protein n=1 Tax=Medicago truncatula TaxID=3880 RepID=A0A072VVX7_MEDTR|nr:hypothetical protein MTR_1g064620 [Medicago truncatula]
MTSKPAIYDLDSDDEDWVFQKHILDDDFESIVDALKKTYHYNPDDCCDEIVSKKIVEVVHDCIVVGKVEAATTIANQSTELAIQKRRKARSPTANADLAIYKATV